MNASSESGLWATVISGSCGVEFSEGRVVSETAVMVEPLFVRENFLTPLGPVARIETFLRLAPWARFLRRFAFPAGCDARGQHHLYNLCGHEPVQANVHRFSERVGESVKPAQASGEEHHFREDSRKYRAGKGLRTTFKHVASGVADKGIRQQKSAGDTE